LDIVVSVIVPAYNVENYIGKGIESVINQSFKNIELIVVDDGSTDKTYSIARQYSSKDNRIKVLRQKNKGVSAARNRGIMEASGKYLIFLDSDDWLDENTVEVLVDLQKKYSVEGLVCVSSYINYLEKDGTIKKTRENTRNTTEKMTSRDALMKFGCADDIVIRSSCYKLYDVDVIKRNNIFFSCRICNGEDGLFVFKYLLYVKEVLFEPVPLWNVLKRQGSFTSSYNPGWLTAIDAVECMIKEPNITKEVRNNLRVYLSDRAMGVAVSGLRSKRMKKEEFNKTKKVIKNTFHLWKNSQDSELRVLKRIIFLTVPYEVLKFLMGRDHQQ
jgi:glycosyltransferase involved in cell wall biosynthesis